MVCGSSSREEVEEINALHGDNESGAYAHRTSAAVAGGASRRGHLDKHGYPYVMRAL